MKAHRPKENAAVAAPFARQGQLLGTFQGGRQVAALPHPCKMLHLAAEVHHKLQAAGVTGL